MTDNHPTLRGTCIAFAAGFCLGSGFQFNGDTETNEHISSTIKRGIYRGLAIATIFNGFYLMTPQSIRKNW